MTFIGAIICIYVGIWLMRLPTREKKFFSVEKDFDAKCYYYGFFVLVVGISGFFIGFTYLD
tara:strand:- start:500 stop:682 length:183 start_codon:yes stop_codon:yes gene_type:complete